MGLLVIALVFVACSCVVQGQGVLPATLPQVDIGGRQSACPSAQILEQARNSTKVAIKSIIRDTVVPALDVRPRCPCGGPGPWRRIAHLDMSDSNQQCPANWGTHTTPVRACGHLTDTRRGCDSAIFSSNSQLYSHVCGRVIAYQKGTPEAFNSGSDSIESMYVDGVSLTHGPAGSRQHIWSFAAALYETVGSSANVCPCTDTTVTWPHQVPPFIQNNYFCDTGDRGPGTSTTAVYSDDPLWDGEGCGPSSSCCQFNTPPWFCTTLPQPANDDVELRICSNGITGGSEDVLVQLVDIFVK